MIGFRVPALNLPIPRVEISTVVASPSTINSDTTIPTAGDSLNPWPLNPVQMYSPSMPSTLSMIGWPSGVLVYRPA